MLRKNNSFVIFGQGLKRRCFSFRRFFVEKSSILFIRLEPSWAGNAKNSIWSSYFLDLKTQICIKLPACILLKKSPSKLSCQTSVFIQNWLGEMSDQSSLRPNGGKYCSAIALLVSYFILVHPRNTIFNFSKSQSTSYLFAGLIVNVKIWNCQKLQGKSTSFLQKCHTLSL